MDWEHRTGRGDSASRGIWVTAAPTPPGPRVPGCRRVGSGAGSTASRGSRRRRGRRWARGPGGTGQGLVAPAPRLRTPPGLPVLRGKMVREMLGLVREVRRPLRNRPEPLGYCSVGAFTCLPWQEEVSPALLLQLEGGLAGFVSWYPCACFKGVRVCVSEIMEQVLLALGILDFAGKCRKRFNNWLRGEELLIGSILGSY